MSSALPARPRLDRDRIVEALLEIGVDRFSMHAIARHLGVSTTALYRYFSSREELLAAAMDAFCARLDLPETDQPWPDYLRALAIEFRRALLAMPGAAAYGTSVGPATPAAFEIVESALTVLRKGGFESVAAWRTYGLVVNHAFQSVLGQERFAAMEEENGPGGYRIYQLSDEERDRYPEIAQLVSSLYFDFDESFEASLECLISGIVVEHERALARRDRD